VPDEQPAVGGGERGDRRVDVELVQHVRAVATTADAPA
jgi:hypothetical protein